MKKQYNEIDNIDHSDKSDIIDGIDFFIKLAKSLK